MTKEVIEGDVLPLFEPHPAREARSPLLPERHERDLFICDIMDAVPKADMASMEHPVFSLSTKPDLKIRRYENGDKFVEVTPSVKGMATVFDRDILIYVISQTIAALNRKQAVSRTVRMKAHDFLIATNRVTSGEGYEGLRAALERLQGTVISTNVITGGEEIMETFGLIDRAKVVRETRDGRMQDIEITLSEWVYQAIQANEVLTLHPGYFRLRKPLERRMYELARKHCGNQPSWPIGLEKLQNKCGSSSTAREFRRLIKNIIEQDGQHNHFPDYSISLEGDIVTFHNRKHARNAARKVTHSSSEPKVDTEVFARARKAAPGYDVHALFHEWVSWWRDTGEPELANPSAAFIGFCKKRHERSPLN